MMPPMHGIDYQNIDEANIFMRKMYFGTNDANVFVDEF